jgi:hypothetical protein
MISCPVVAVGTFGFVKVQDHRCRCDFMWGERCSLFSHSPGSRRPLLTVNRNCQVSFIFLFLLFMLHVNSRKTLRQAYRGSLSLYLGFMRVSLCFASFYRIYNPLVPQTRFSPLSLQFSSLSDPSFYAEVTGSKVGWLVVIWVFEWSPSPIVPGEVKLNTWLFMSLLSRRSLQRPGIYCQFLVMVHVVDMLIGNWVSYPSNGLRRGKISMVGRFHGSLHLPKKVHCTRIYCLLKARIQALSKCGW